MARQPEASGEAGRVHEAGSESWSSPQRGSQLYLVPFTVKSRGGKKHYAHKISSYPDIHLLIHSLDISSPTKFLFPHH